MKNLTATAPLTLALLVLAGCGGESQGGSIGTVSTGISASKALGDVTTAEATEGCTHLQDAIETRFQQPSSKTGLCTLLGLSLSSTEAACTSLRDSCVKGDTGTATTSDDVSLDAFDPGQQLQCSGTNIDDWHGCTATVGEMETCINDMLEGLDALLNSYTCKDAGTSPPNSSEDCLPPARDANGNIAIDPATGQPYVDHCSASFEETSPPPPASCRALQVKCPNLDLFGE
jgi:hypothetical protein